MTNPFTRMYSWIRRRHKPRRVPIVHGWTAGFCTDGGIQRLITVTAASQREAVCKLIAAGHEVVDAKYVKPTITIPADCEVYLPRGAKWQEYDLRSQQEVPTP